ncbi:MAG: hypothetical protein WKF60_12805, partial [Ilumatobacter sp.]
TSAREPPVRRARPARRGRDDVFQLVEDVRRTAVSARRAGENPIESLSALLDDTPTSTPSST